MKIQAMALVLCLTFLGCQNEPMTPREEAEQAQDNLEKARVHAAEVIAESEEEAVEIIADAKADAQEEVKDATRQASEIISDAKEDLTQKLNELGETPQIQLQPSLEPKPTKP
jgi:F0F1-type ATP synthase membrane subunit b/b'